MSIYSKVMQTAKDLQEDFGNKLTLAESLQIAVQIVQTETLSDGLQTGVTNEPVFLEAIAMALGFAPKNERMFSSTVADSLKAIASKD